MAPAPQEQAASRAPSALAWTLAGALLVVILPWLQRWLYLVPELDHRLFLGRDFLELAAQRAYFYRGLLDGKLLLWDPLMVIGLPFMDYLFDLFNPLSLINAFFLEEGLLRADYLQVVLTAHCSLAGLGAFLLGRQLSLGRAAATVMGVVMGCMGMVVAHSEHSMMIQTLWQAPFVFLFLHRARTGRGLVNAAWAGVFLGWSFMGGIPQIFYYLGVAATLYILYAAVEEFSRAGWRPAWRLALGPYLLMGLAALLFALPNLIHLALAALNDPVGVHDASALYGSRRLAFISQGSGGWWIIPHFLAPKLLGGHAENTAYVGVLPLALALMAVAWVRRQEAGFWKLLGLLGLVLMMGASMGLHKVLVSLLPGYYLFRETVRWMFLLHLALLVLAGFGLHWLLHRAREAELATLRRFLAVLATILAGLMLAGLSLEHLRDSPLALVPAMPLMGFLAWLLFNLGALWWAALRRSQGASPCLVALLLVGLVALDLGFYHAPTFVGGDPVMRADPTKPDPVQEAQAASLARMAAGPPPGRVLISRVGGAVGYQGPTYRNAVDFINPCGGYMDRRLPLGFWQIWWSPRANPRYMNLLNVNTIDRSAVEAHAAQDRWTLCGYSQSALRLASVRQVRALSLKAELMFQGGARPGDTLARLALVRGGQAVASWPLRLGKEISGRAISLPLPEAVRAQAVVLASTHPKALVRVNEIKLNGALEQDRPRLKDLGQGFSRNLAARGPAWFVSRAAVVNPEWEYKHVLASVDPSRVVVFRDAPPGWQPPRGLAAGSGGEAALQSWQAQSARIKVKAERPGWLVISQGAYHGWSARLDGRPAPIRKAYGFLQAIAVPAGDHEVSLSYGEPLVAASLAVPPLLVLGIIAAGLWRRRKGRAAPK
ncbi:MAG: YfhO family protein [Desulfarculaceae bacterium]|nr:YfhO family protein [Desulfarculaceae bacterium]MCF8072758.1 YfhO family protein [Desulfarculaceae bacterium]MCF8100926.1 YfhO family protein [Desulfarculaceae bacterium]MCF8118552.1 YfhO family protein [Desulfarculaceae bacterium]